MAHRCLRVLVVDDDEEDFLILRDLLADYGEPHLVTWAATLEEGKRHLREASSDVYLVDWRLGPDNGLDLVRYAETCAARRPVILLTGKGNTDVDREALQAGAADY